MKKILLLAFLALAQASDAQMGSRELLLVGEATLPVFQKQRGPGLHLKLSYGLTHASALTFTAGVSRFRFTGLENKGTVIRLIPFVAGLRVGNRWYLEPQIGIGEMGGKEDIGGDYARNSVAAIFGGINLGYKKDRFHAGIRFQTGKGMEGKDAGSWHDRAFHYTAAFIGYRIFPGK